MRQVEIYIVSDEEIKPSIAIVIEKSTTGGPLHVIAPQPGLASHICERAVAVVVHHNRQHRPPAPNRLGRHHADARVDLAKLYVKESRWNEALQQLDRARSLDSKNKAVYSTLAIVYRHLQRPELATAMLGILNQLNEDDRKAQPV